MLKVFFILTTYVAILGCKTEYSVELDQINGYWQIESIQQKNEIFKNKQTDLLYDFYSTKNNEGVYKKVAPQIDGSFQTSQDIISFKIIEGETEFILLFSSRWDEWKKTIKHLDSEKLILFHQERSFLYKRPKPNKINF